VPPRHPNKPIPEQEAIQDRNQPKKSFFFSAGEISGDAHAAELIREMGKLGDFEFAGLGGKNMFAAGLRSAFGDVSTLSTVGFVETIYFLGKKVRLLNRALGYIKQNPPDAVVLIDNQGFNILLGREAKKLGIPVFYYLPPSVSVWAEWNAPKVAEICDHLICNIEADTHIYRKFSRNVYFPGNPVIDKISRFSPDPAFLPNLGLDPAKTTVSIFPGSRHQELKKLLNIMLDAAKILIEKHGFQVLLPLSHEGYRERIERAIERKKLTGKVTLVADDPYSVMNASAVNIMASGTATLESVLMRKPPVICYRIFPISFMIGKRLVKKQMIGLPNIFLDKKVFPELLQGACGPENIVRHALRFLDSDAAYHDELNGYYGLVRGMMGAPGVSLRAARYILKHL